MSEEQLQQKISSLEAQLKLKEAELKAYKIEINKTNAALQRLISLAADDLKWAQAIQKRLSPAVMPHVPGLEVSSKFLSGDEIGGDYFDFVSLTDKMKIGFILSASGGHGLAAMLLGILVSTQAKNLVREAEKSSKVVEDLIKELDHERKPNLPLPSLLYAIFDRRHFQLDLSWRGDLLVLKNSGATGEVTVCVSPLTPLQKAIKDSVKVQSLTLNLEAKDRLIFCSPGVIEACDSAEISEMVQQAPRLGVHELRNEIVFGVQQSSKTATPHRDQTVVVLEVQEHLIKLA